MELAGLGVEFVVGDITYGSGFVFHPIPKAMTRMVQQHGVYFYTVDVQGLLFQIAKGNHGAEFLDVDRKIDAVHLPRDKFPGGNVAVGGTADFNFVALNIQGLEKGEGIDVVPVWMGNENFGSDKGSIFSH